MSEIVGQPGTQVSTVQRVLRGQVVRLLAATAIGAVTGWLVFSFTQVTGRHLFVITGGITGAVTVLVLQMYQRTARLTEVKVTVHVRGQQRRAASSVVVVHRDGDANFHPAAGE
ncbi:hypothetical protein ACH4HG_22425 [Streptomyces coeruleorubidus]|uniref:hypothetical protein n=1 Tax=Streptomyces coeruleorubidus TaxID=116188 RepID=UPI0037BB71B4